MIASHVAGNPASVFSIDFVVAGNPVSAFSTDFVVAGNPVSAFSIDFVAAGNPVSIFSTDFVVLILKHTFARWRNCILILGETNFYTTKGLQALTGAQPHAQTAGEQIISPP